MQAWRQLGGGVIIGIFSAILVIGGIFLSLPKSGRRGDSNSDSAYAPAKFSHANRCSD